MYCKNCGSPIPDDSKFCTYCGTSVPPMTQQIPPSQNPTANQQAPKSTITSQPAPQNQFPQQVNPQPASIKTKLIALIVATLVPVLLFVIVGACVACFFKPDKEEGFQYPEETVENFYDAIKEGDADLMLSLVPKAYRDYLLEQYDLDESSLKNIVHGGLNDILADMEDSYGNIKEMDISFKYSHTVASDIDALNEWFEEENIHLSVSTGYVYYVTIQGKEEDEKQLLTSTYYTIWIDGRWYSLEALVFINSVAAQNH